MSIGKYITDLEQEVKSLREEVDILTKQHAILMDRLGSWWRCPRVHRKVLPGPQASRMGGAARCHGGSGSIWVSHP